MFEATIKNNQKITKTDILDEDGELVLDAKKNISDFRKIYEKWLRPVYRYCYFRVGNRNDAEDLTSQIFLKAYEGFPAYQHRGVFSAWLFSIARARVTDFYRKKSKHLHIHEVSQIPDDSNLSMQVAENQVLDQVLKMIDHLPEKKKELIRLRFVAELTYKEIGALIHRREDAVRKAISRLLERIKKEVNHE